MLDSGKVGDKPRQQLQLDFGPELGVARAGWWAEPDGGPIHGGASDENKALRWPVSRSPDSQKSVQD